MCRLISGIVLKIREFNNSKFKECLCVKTLDEQRLGQRGIDRCVHSTGRQNICKQIKKKIYACKIDVYCDYGE
jgi:hypothetical protein